MTFMFTTVARPRPVPHDALYTLRHDLADVISQEVAAIVGEEIDRHRWSDRVIGPWDLETRIRHAALWRAGFVGGRRPATADDLEALLAATRALRRELDGGEADLETEVQPMPPIRSGLSAAAREMRMADLAWE